MNSFTDTQPVDIDPADSAVITKLPSYDTVRHGRVYKYAVDVSSLEVIAPGLYRLPSGKRIRLERGSPEYPGMCRIVD